MATGQAKNYRITLKSGAVAEVEENEIDLLDANWELSPPVIKFDRTIIWKTEIAAIERIGEPKTPNAEPQDPIEAYRQRVSYNIRHHMDAFIRDRLGESAIKDASRQPSDPIDAYRQLTADDIRRRLAVLDGEHKALVSLLQAKNKESTLKEPPCSP